MDYRTESFRKRFIGAAQAFGITSENIVSLKLREIVNSSAPYNELIDTLTREAGLNYKRVDNNLGQAHLFSDNKNKIILIEHESGLEILYIAGSIASLIGLVPLILQYWNTIRNHFNGRHHFDRHDMDIRRIDSNGNLHEEHIHEIDMFRGAISTTFPTAELIENEMKTLRKQIYNLTLRIENVEKRIVGKSRPRKSIKKYRRNSNKD